MSALIGSSRVLKALADDEIFGPVLNFVRYGKTRSGNPWMAVIISFIVAEIVLLVGSLNAIAPLVTIFYLLAYFGINLACLALDLASAPNFRSVVLCKTHCSCSSVCHMVSLTLCIVLLILV